MPIMTSRTNCVDKPDLRTRVELIAQIRRSESVAGQPLHDQELEPEHNKRTHFHELFMGSPDHKRSSNLVPTICWQQGSGCHVRWLPDAFELSDQTICQILDQPALKPPDPQGQTEPDGAVSSPREVHSTSRIDKGTGLSTLLLGMGCRAIVLSVVGMGTAGSFGSGHAAQCQL